MSQNRRVLAYVAIALIVGAALAFAVALSYGGGDDGATGASVGGDKTVANLYADDGDSGGLSTADAAKEEPLLDKFSAKDPFIPFATASGTATSASSATPTATSTASSSTLSAKVKVEGTSYNVSKGDKVPGGSAAAFTVTAVSSGDVTFEVIDGTLKNGDKTFPVNLGEAVRVTLESGSAYDISVVSIGSSSGGSGGSSTSHSITVLSITSQNGTAMATFEVDGKTYSDKKQGDVFSTSWGQIEVVSINVDAQTVTILHGDQTLTLQAGEVVVK